ncbi:OB-fold protein [Psychroflexus sp. MES1-P1E]|uniref:OB-fold protein n=1 Tax=Psychroflexus sp. MES1-P1E TaxID=2058320 RepID=UPI000C795F5C|nr:hypothetical protein [Psychroflexus sp. MES1-P1E]PKG43784.1 hypothetical protein CXF67_03175 [Psychroflexus sp. MES1-P1E]
MKLLKRVTISVSIFILVVLVFFGITIFIKSNKAPFDVTTAKVDFQVSTSELTKEFTIDYAKANEKYFTGNSGSKVLLITGVIYKIDKNMRDDITVLLKSNESSPFGVHCTFSSKDLDFKKEQIVTVKGLLNSGLHYDSDLDLYENAILDKSILVE